MINHDKFKQKLNLGTLGLENVMANTPIALHVRVGRQPIALAGPQVLQVLQPASGIPHFPGPQLDLGQDG